MAQSKAKEKRVENANSKVNIANSVSILDYANKNDMEIVYEDQNVARITDTGDGVITVFKESNSWTAGDEAFDDSKTYGNTIRFVARMEHTDWMNAMNLLVEERGDYLSVEEYNKGYQEEEKVQNGRNTRLSSNLSRDRAVIQKIKELSISDYLKASGVPVKDFHNEKFSVIDNTQFEGLILYNQTNTWDWNSKVLRNQDIIAMDAHLRGISREEAVENLKNYMENGLIENMELTGTNQNSIQNASHSEEMLLNNEKVNEDEDKTQTEIQTETQIKTKEIATEEIPKTPDKKTMSKEQLEQILAGYRIGIDVSAYDNVELTPDQMRELKVAVAAGVDAKEFNNPILTASYMKEMRLAAQSDISLSVFKDETGQFQYSAEQAREVRMGYSNGLTAQEVAIYAYGNLDPKSMKELRIGLQDGIFQMKNLSNGNYSAKDIHAIRMTITINQIMDSIKLKLRNLYDSIVSLIKRSIVFERETMQMSSDIRMDQTEPIDAEQKAVYELKDAIEEIYHAMEEEIQELPLEQKKELITEALREALYKARAMEETVAAQNHSEAQKAVDELVEEIELEELKQAAYESLQEEYVEQFYENENSYNEKLIEFTDSVLNDPNMEAEKKSEVFQRTLGVMFGSQVANKWIERLHPQQQANPLSEKHMQLIKEEYEQMVTVTEELVQEVG